MSSVLLVGNRSLMLDLLLEHIETGGSDLFVTQVDYGSAAGEMVTSASVIVLVEDATEREVATAIGRLREVYVSVPICVLTARTGRQEVLDLIRSGAQGVILTRNSLSSLVPILRLLIAGEIFAPALMVYEDASGQNRFAFGDFDVAPAPPLTTNDTRLTKREQEVAHVLFRGKSNKEIARDLGMRENTVKIHVRNLLKKIGARSRGEAIALYIWKTRLPPLSL